MLLTPQHVQRFAHLKQEYPGFPKLAFFRHVAGVSGAKPDQPFGNKMFYKRWMTTCENLGIEGLDLYAGTRHTTITEIARRKGGMGTKIW